jgi:hypothetical protein
VLTEKQLARYKSFDQLRLGIIEPVKLKQLDP